MWRSSLVAMAAVAVLAVSVGIVRAAHASAQPPSPTARGLDEDASSARVVHVVLDTSYGDIVLELNRELAPITVENFLSYVESGFYDGTVFHRVIHNFMIQGGGMTADMLEKPVRAPIKNEWQNGLKNKRGTIAMARMREPDSAAAQFFINVSDNASLDAASASMGNAGHAVFGRVVEGMDVVDKIRIARTGSRGLHQNVPIEPVVIERASIRIDAPEQREDDREQLPEEHVEEAAPRSRSTRVVLDPPTIDRRVLGYDQPSISEWTLINGTLRVPPRVTGIGVRQPELENVLRNYDDLYVIASSGVGSDRIGELLTSIVESGQDVFATMQPPGFGISLPTKAALMWPEGAKGMTPLHVAAFNGHAKVCDELLRTTEKLSSRKTNAGYTVVAVVLDAADAAGNTAMHYAVANGREDVFSTLLRQGVKGDQFNANGDRALNLACRAKWSEAVKLLIEAGVSPRIQQSGGPSAWTDAIESDVTEIVHACIPLMRSEPLSTDLVHELSGLCLAQSLQALIEAKMVTGKEAMPDRSIPLHVAGCDTVAKTLLGVYPEGVREWDSQKRTPVHLAAGMGREQVLVVLLDAWPNGLDNADCGLTPLAFAARNGQLNTTELLLRKSADVNALSNDGSTVLMHAVAGANTRVVKALVLANADVSRRDRTGRNAIMHAARQSNAFVLDELLLAEGARSTIDETDSAGNTALHHAAEAGSVRCAEVIIKAGATAGIANKRGQTALDLAHASGQVEIVRLLRNQ